MTETLTTPTQFDEAPGLTARGTIIVIAGRGEAAGVYARFGRRLAADSYRVRVIDATVNDVGAARTGAEALLCDESLPSPKVLVGSDAGAVLALDLAAASPGLATALVIVGLPVSPQHVAAGGDAELRSACPVHRRTLDDGSLVDSGALARPLPNGLALPAAGSIHVPVLVIHGEADVVAPFDEVLPYYHALPHAHILTTVNGRHDALNDLSHRSVAASIVLFLERVRQGDMLPAVLHRRGADGVITAAD